MNKREGFKEFDFEDRQWSIGKFDARLGAYIAFKLMSETMPFGLNSMAGVPASPGGKIMSRNDFFELENDCLGVCRELLPAGPTPVLDVKGNWQVQGMDTNAGTVIALMVQVLAFNLRDFFNERLLASLLEAFTDMKLPTALTSPSLSSLPS